MSNSNQPFMGTINPGDARQQDIINIRRQFVAELLADELDVDAIHIELALAGSKFHTINPETKSAWTKATISNDINKLMEESREQMVIETRRNRVKRLRLRGFTQTEIYTAMSTPGKNGKKSKNYFPNPNTGEPYSFKTIERDIVAIREDSLKVASQDLDTVRARLLAEYQEVKAAAWASGKLGVVLKAIGDEAKLMGANQPETINQNINMDNRSAKDKLREKIERFASIADERLADSEEDDDNSDTTDNKADTNPTG